MAIIKNGLDDYNYDDNKYEGMDDYNYDYCDKVCDYQHYNDNYEGQYIILIMAIVMNELDDYNYDDNNNYEGVDDYNYDNYEGAG